jgi:hypothetical protein
MVTALWSQPAANPVVTTPSHLAVSIADVAPGSELVVPVDIAPTPLPSRMTVRVSESSLPSSTAKVYLFLSCRAAVPIEDATVSLPYGGCPGSDTFDAIVLALDGEGKLRGAMTWENEPIVDGLETTFTLFSTAFSTAPASLELEPQNLPPFAEFNPFLTSVSLISHAPTGEWANTFSSTIQWVVPKVVPPFAAAGGTFDVTVQLHNGIDRTYGHRERRADMADGLVYAFRDLAMPVIDVSDLTTARPSVSYSLAADATLGDAIATTIDWGLEPNRWVVHAPASLQGEVVIPELPEALADWRPQPPLMRATVTHSDMDGATGRDELLSKRSGPSWYIANSSANTN